METRVETHNEWMVRNLASLELETKLETSDRCPQCEINAFILKIFPKRRRKQVKIPFLEQLPKGLHTCNPLNSLYRKLFNVAIDDYPKHKVDLNKLKRSLESGLLNTRLQNGTSETTIPTKVETKSNDEKTNNVLPKFTKLFNNCSNETTYLSPSFYNSTSDKTQFKIPFEVPSTNLKRRVKAGESNIDSKRKRSVSFKTDTKFSKKEILPSRGPSSYVLNHRFSQQAEIASECKSVTKEAILKDGHLKSEVKTSPTFSGKTEMCPLTKSVYDMLSSTDPPIPTSTRSKSKSIDDKVEETESKDFNLQELIQGIYLSFEVTTPPYPF